MIKPKKYRYWTGTEMLLNVGVHPFLMTRHEKDPDDQLPNDKFLNNTDEGCVTTTPGENLTEFIGLYDADWKEIYEEDIVSGNYKGKPFTSTVKWNQQNCMFWLINESGNYIHLNALLMYSDERGISLSNVTVTGNTFVKQVNLELK